MFGYWIEKKHFLCWSKKQVSWDKFDPKTHKEPKLSSKKIFEWFIFSYKILMFWFLSAHWCSQYFFSHSQLLICHELPPCCTLYLLTPRRTKKLENISNLINSKYFFFKSCMQETLIRLTCLDRSAYNRVSVHGK